VTGPPTGNAHSSVWVGIDGYGNGTVEHVGTAQHVHHGVATYVAWWEMRSKLGHQPQQTIHSMTVNRSYQFARGLRGELQSVGRLKMLSRPFTERAGHKKPIALVCFDS
jgi:Peptidase A4 family